MKLRILCIFILSLFFSHWIFGQQKNNVETMVIQSKTLNKKVTKVGSIKPIEIINMRSANDGVIEKISLEVGDKINKNQIIAHVDTKRFKQTVRLQYLALRRALLQIVQIEQNLLQSQNAIKSAQQNFLTIQKEYEREKKLFEKNFTSQANLDKLNSALQNAKTQYQNALLAIYPAKKININKFHSRKILAFINANKDLSKFKFRKQKINSLPLLQAITTYQSEVTQYKLRLIELEKSKIRAPFDGIILERFVDNNESIGKGKAIVNLGKVNEMISEIYLNELEINQMKINNEVIVTLDAINKKSFNGTTWKISSYAQPKTKNYLVKIKIQNQNNLLKSNMTSRNRFSLVKTQNQILIPNNAILEREKGKVVFVIGKENRVIEKKITLGDSINNEIQVLSGLQVGDELVIKGQQFLVENEQVNVIK